MPVEAAREGRRLLITLGFPPWVGGMQHLLYQRCCLTPTAVWVAAPGRGRAPAWDAAQPFPIWRWPGGPHGLPGWRRVAQTFWAWRGMARVRDRTRLTALELGQALPFGLVALWARRRWGLPYALWAYGDDILKPFARAWIRPLLRRILAEAAAIYAVSRYTARQAIHAGAPAERVHVVYPWPAPAFQPGNQRVARQRLGLPEDALLLLTVARLDPRKGVDRVLAVLPALARAWPRLRYAVVGEGPARPRWQALAERLGVGDRVLWPGRVDTATLRHWYQAADVFVLVPTPGPGEVEGFGLVYVEAAACGLPAVAGHNGGTPEAVRHGETGLVVPPEASALQAALHTLLADPARREHLGTNALAHANALREAAWRYRSLWLRPLR